MRKYCLYDEEEGFSYTHITWILSPDLVAKKLESQPTLQCFQCNNPKHIY